MTNSWQQVMTPEQFQERKHKVRRSQQITKLGIATLLMGGAMAPIPVGISFVSDILPDPSSDLWGAVMVPALVLVLVALVLFGIGADPQSRRHGFPQLLKCPNCGEERPRSAYETRVVHIDYLEE